MFKNEKKVLLLSHGYGHGSVLFFDKKHLPVSVNIIRNYNIYVRAQNNGRSPDNDQAKMPLDRSVFYLTGQFFTSPVSFTGHICMPSDRILNCFFFSVYLLKSCQRKTVYFIASTQFHCKYVKLRSTKTSFALVQNVNICWLHLKGFDFVLIRLFTVC